MSRPKIRYNIGSPPRDNSKSIEDILKENEEFLIEFEKAIS